MDSSRITAVVPEHRQCAFDLQNRHAVLRFTPWLSIHLRGSPNGSIFHLPTNRRELQPKRKVEKSEVPVGYHKVDPEPLVPSKQKVVVHKQRKRQVQSKPAGVSQVFAVRPISNQRVPSQREIHRGDEKQNHQLCPQVPLLVVLWQSYDVKGEPGYKTIDEKLSVFS